MDDTTKLLRQATREAVASFTGHRPHDIEKIDAATAFMRSTVIPKQQRSLIPEPLTRETREAQAAMDLVAHGHPCFTATSPLDALFPPFPTFLTGARAEQPSSSL